MTKDKALKLALEALESMKETLAEHDEPTTFNEDQAITAIKEALAQPEQEPAAFSCLRCVTPKKCAVHGCSPNTWPSEYSPKRPLVGLTDEFCITNMFDMGHYSLQIVFKSRKNADEFKAALKEKNT